MANNGIQDETRDTPKLKEKLIFFKNNRKYSIYYCCCSSFDFL